MEEENLQSINNVPQREDHTLCGGCHASNLILPAAVFADVVLFRYIKILQGDNAVLDGFRWFSMVLSAAE